MKKLFALRQHIIKSLPNLNTDPDRLLSFIEDGSVKFYRGPNLTHQWNFTAQFILVEFAMDVDVLIVAIVQWLAVYEPDVDPEQAIQVEAELTSETSCDLILRITLSERVIVTVNKDKQQLEAKHTMPRFEEPVYAGEWSLFMRDGDNLDLLAKWDNGPWGLGNE
ncbi:hypothetical protein LMG33818_002624 [Halomonadaceae bacterium LMG 33818]|uniref:phage tail protein n=1 Tax=Cernens ardua TaxID=3402176 RepID=UPI003EDC4095